MTNKNDMVVSLRRGVTMQNLDVGEGVTLAQFLQTIADLHVEVTEDLPTGEAATILIDDNELQKLEARIGDRCFIVRRAIGKSNI